MGSPGHLYLPRHPDQVGQELKVLGLRERHFVGLDATSRLGNEHTVLIFNAFCFHPIKERPLILRAGEQPDDHRVEDHLYVILCLLRRPRDLPGLVLTEGVCEAIERIRLADQLQPSMLGLQLYVLFHIPHVVLREQERCRISEQVSGLNFRLERISDNLPVTLAGIRVAQFVPFIEVQIGVPLRRRLPERVLGVGQIFMRELDVSLLGHIYYKEGLILVSIHFGKSV